MDPWGRLRNTATFIAATTFGTAEAAERAVAIVKAVHKRVYGTMPDGALRAQLADFDSELASTEAARGVATFLLHTPPVPWLVRPGYGLVTSGALALLPPWARRELGVRASTALDPLRRAGGAAITATIRWALDSKEPGLAPEPVTAG